MQQPFSVTRRSLLAGGTLVAGGVLLGGCASSQSPRAVADADSTPGEQSWTFLDDRRQTITLPRRPETIVAFSTPTAALAELGITPAGIYAWSPLKDDTQLRYTDLTGVETIGEVWGELNLELMATVAPDVIVSSYDPTDDSLPGISDEQRDRVAAIAPILAIDNTAPLLTQFDRFQELGAALGADLGSVALLDQRQQFNDLSQQLETAAQAKPGLRVMAVSASEKGMNVAQPKPNPDLTYYGSLGLDFVVPEGEGIFWWQELAAEKIDTYDADVILVDARSGDSDRLALEKLKLWSTLPAVRAGQVFAWHAYDPPTYRFYTDALTDLLAAVEGSQVLS